MRGISLAQIFRMISIKTLSLPIVMAKMRGYKMLVLLYSFTMSFSLLLTMTGVEGLGWSASLLANPKISSTVCIFATHGQALSVIYTLLQISDFHPETRYLLSTSIGLISFCHLFSDVENHWSIATALLPSFLMFAVSWGTKSYKAKEICPEWAIWEQTLLPGFLLLSLSICLRLGSTPALDSDITTGFGMIAFSLSLALLVSSKKRKSNSENEDMESPDKFRFELNRMLRIRFSSMRKKQSQNTNEDKSKVSSQEAGQ